MQIKSPGPGGPGRPGPRQAEGLAAGKPVEGAGAQAPEAKSRAKDEIQISGAARELLGAARESVPELGSIEPERLRMILDRINSGYYDRDDVRQEVLGQLADDLGLDAEAT